MKSAPTFSKPMLLAVLLVALAGCTDAERASLLALGDEATVVCYSGGQEVFRDTSTGKVAQLDGDGITFKSGTDGGYVRAFADCIVKSQGRE